MLLLRVLLYQTELRLLPPDDDDRETYGSSRDLWEEAYGYEDDYDTPVFMTARIFGDLHKVDPHPAEWHTSVYFEGRDFPSGAKYRPDWWTVHNDRATVYLGNPDEDFYAANEEDGWLTFDLKPERERIAVALDLAKENPLKLPMSAPGKRTKTKSTDGLGSTLLRGRWRG